MKDFSGEAARVHARLTHCPECGYDLRGLPPAPYRCPECGFEYDEFTRVWRAKGSWRIYFGVFATNAFLFVQLPDVLRGSLHQKPVAIAMAFLILGLISFYVLRVYAAHRRGRVVVICRDGLLIRQIGKPLLVPWIRLVSIRVDSSGRVELTCSDAALTRKLNHVNMQTCVRQTIGMGKEAEEFVEAANAAREHYLGLPREFAGSGQED